MTTQQIFKLAELNPSWLMCDRAAPHFCVAVREFDGPWVTFILTNCFDGMITGYEAIKVLFKGHKVDIVVELLTPEEDGFASTYLRLPSKF